MAENEDMDMEIMTVMKERIDRLMQELELTEQKITFLEQSIDRQNELMAQIKAEKEVIERESAELRVKVMEMK